MTAPIITPGRLTRVFLHSYNVSCESAEVAGTFTSPLIDAPTFCGITRVRGIEAGEYSLRGYWATDDPTLERQLSQVFDGTISPAFFVDAPWCEAGKPCYGGEIKSSTVTITTPVENVITVAGDLSLVTPDRNVSQGGGVVHRGHILYYAGDDGVTLAGGSSTTNGTAVNVGRSIGGRLLVHFRLSWVPPLTDYVTVTLQHSPNGTTGWANFTGVSITVRADTMGPGNAVLLDTWNEVTEDAYWRVVLTRTGSNAKLFFNLFIWAQINTGGGADGSFVIVEDSDGTWVDDSDSSEYVIK